MRASRLAAVILFAAAPAMATAGACGSCCDSCDGCCDVNRPVDFCPSDLFCDCCACDLLGGLGCGCGPCGGWDITGWIDAGYYGNTDSPASKFNGPYNAIDRSNEAMMNQLYLVAEKGLPCCGRGIGARVDVLYGEDYFLAESIGIEKNQDGSANWNNEYYGTAIPQAYVAIGNQSANLQVGHFYSVVGYEGVMAPDNFFYGKSYSYQFAGPFTHWGAQANWKPSSDWTVTAGLHNGWDAFDRVTDRVGFVGKIRYDDPCSDTWTSFAITTGDESNNSAGIAPNPGYTNRTRYSWLVGVPVSCRVDYVFHHWLGLQEGGAADGGQANWHGIDQYLYYTVNRCWKAGVRFEWFRDEDGTRVGLNRPSNPNKAPFAGDFYSLTFGLNYTPNDCLTIRPEVRADWYDGDATAANPFNDGAANEQYLIGCDAILRF